MWDQTNLQRQKKGLARLVRDWRPGHLQQQWHFCPRSTIIRCDSLGVAPAVVGAPNKGVEEVLFSVAPKAGVLAGCPKPKPGVCTSMV